MMENNYHLLDIDENCGLLEVFHSKSPNCHTWIFMKDIPLPPENAKAQAMLFGAKLTLRIGVSNVIWKSDSLPFLWCKKVRMINNSSTLDSLQKTLLCSPHPLGVGFLSIPLGILIEFPIISLIWLLATWILSQHEVASHIIIKSTWGSLSYAMWQLMIGHVNVQ